MSRQALIITPIASDAEREACARIMADSEPWITLGIGLDRARGTLAANDREIFVARDGEVVAGFIIVMMQGVLSGYVQTLAVAGPYRGHGVGAMLLQFAEARIFRERPNVFLFVSSFNPRAQRFYEAHGYVQVGTLADFLVRGHAEHLMRKTTGPLLR